MNKLRSGRGQTWKYSRGIGWEEIDEFLPGAKDGVDSYEHHATHGYKLHPFTSIGDFEGNALSISIFLGERGETAYDYLGYIDIGFSECKVVGIPTFPDLISFLNETAPISALTHLSIQIEEWTENLKIIAEK